MAKRLQNKINDIKKNESLYVSIKNDDFHSEEIIDEEKYKSISSSAFIRKKEIFKKGYD